MPRVYVLCRIIDCGGQKVPRAMDTSTDSDDAELWHATRERPCGCEYVVYTYACDRMFTPRKKRK